MKICIIVCLLLLLQTCDSFKINRIQISSKYHIFQRSQSSALKPAYRPIALKHQAQPFYQASNPRSGRSAMLMDRPRSPWKVDSTNILIAMNIGLHALSLLLPQITSAMAKSNLWVSRGQRYRLLTALFAHASMGHLLMNMYTLMNLGPVTEKVLGMPQFIFVYIVSGMLANLFTYLTNASPLSLGASPSIYGLMGAMAMFYYRNLNLAGGSASQGLQRLMKSFGANILQSLLFSGATNIDYTSHIAGFIGGAGLASILLPSSIGRKAYGVYR